MHLGLLVTKVFRVLQDQLEPPAIRVMWDWPALLVESVLVDQLVCLVRRVPPVPSVSLAHKVRRVLRVRKVDRVQQVYKAQLALKVRRVRLEMWASLGSRDCQEQLVTLEEQETKEWLA